METEAKDRSGLSNMTQGHRSGVEGKVLQQSAWSLSPQADIPESPLIQQACGGVTSDKIYKQISMYTLTVYNHPSHN